MRSAEYCRFGSNCCRSTLRALLGTGARLQARRRSVPRAAVGWSAHPGGGIPNLRPLVHQGTGGGHVRRGFRTVGRAVSRADESRSEQRTRWRRSRFLSTSLDFARTRGSVMTRDFPCGTLQPGWVWLEIAQRAGPMGSATMIMPDTTKLRVNGTWWHSILPVGPCLGHAASVVFTHEGRSCRHVGRGVVLSRSIRRRMSANRSRGMATSAIWKTI